MVGIKRMAVTAVLIAAGIVLPVVFHMIPAAVGGRALLPMHIPILFAGLVAGPVYGFFAGLITPILSSMATGMPAAGLVTYRMMVELSVYGAVAGVSMKFVRTNRTSIDLYISLLAAMVAGRIAAGLAQAFVFFDGAYYIGLWISSYFVTSLPGIVMQLIFIPVIYFALEKARLIPARYQSNQRRGNVQKSS